MNGNLTDLDGIGPKTAEKLRSKGITSKQKLAEMSRQGRLRGESRRVQDAGRNALLEQQGSFVDPVSGAEVTEENRAAFDMIASKRVSDFDSISVSAQNPKVTPDDQVRDFIEPVKKGKFKTRTGGDDNLLAFAADAADNLDAATLSSGELQDLNRAAETAQDEVMLREQFESGHTSAQGTVGVGDFLAANAVHETRSAEAQQIDGRREAEETRDFEEWQKDPSRHDFPGVDTPKGSDQFFPETRTKKKRHGLGSTERTNEDRQVVKSAADEFSQLNDEQTKRIFGQELDITDPFGDTDDNGGIY